MIGQITQELELDLPVLDRAPPSPAVLRRVGLEIHAVERSLDAAKVSVRLDVRDEQDVNVGRAEVLGNQIVVARKQLGYQAAEHDEEHIIVAQLI